MKSITYLQEKLSELFDKIPSIKIQYEFRERLNTHIIHILPETLYNDDITFAELQIELEDDFEGTFPNEEIMFMTDNELISIENPIFSLGHCEEDIDYTTIFPPVKIQQPIVTPQPIGINWANSLIVNKFEMPTKKKKFLARFNVSSSSNKDDQTTNSLNLAA